jgi:hypothetical protein
VTAPLRGICVDPATGAYTDPVATPLLGDVLQAVVDLYEAPGCGAEPPCAWLVVAGDQVQVERGGYTGRTDAGADCSGLLTVRLVSLQPTEAFPVGPSGPIRQLDMSWACRLEVGVWRPYPEPVETADGLVLPTVEEEQAANDVALLDAAVVRAALTHHAETNDTAYLLESYLPWGPMGGVVGGVTTAQFEIV